MRQLAIAIVLFASTLGVAATPIQLELEQRIKTVFELGYSPGMAVVVVRGDEVLIADGFGVADMAIGRAVTPDTAFYIASSTKAFTAFAITAMAERNEINLDAPLTDFIPQVKLQEPLDPTRITLLRLLTHTHGLYALGPIVFRTAYTGQWDQQTLVSLLDTYKQADYGESFRYTNLGYNIAGLMIQEKYKLDWRKLVEREIFKPLGMQNTTAFISKVAKTSLAMPHDINKDLTFQRIRMAKSDDTMHAAGGLVTTANDMARWLIANLNGGVIDNTQIFPKDLVTNTQTQQVEQDRNFLMHHRYGYTLGWDMATWEGKKLLTRFGGFEGFYSHMSLMPEEKFGVAVLVNGATIGGPMAETVATIIYQTLLDQGEEAIKSSYVSLDNIIQGQKSGFIADLEKRLARPQTLQRPVNQYQGTFHNDQYGTMTWSANGDKLVMRIGDVLIDPVEVFAAEKDQFRIDFGAGGMVAGFKFNGEKVERVDFLNVEFTPK